MRRSNLLTLRKFFNWKSTWCSKFFYKSLLYKDLFIQFYLSSIFFKLKLNSSSIKLHYLSTNLVICTVDIYINSLFRLKRYNEFFFLKNCIVYEYISNYIYTNLNYRNYNFRITNYEELFLNFIYSIYGNKLFLESKELIQKLTICFFDVKIYKLLLLVNDNAFLQVKKLNNLYFNIQSDLNITINSEYNYKNLFNVKFNNNMSMFNNIFIIKDIDLLYYDNLNHNIVATSIFLNNIQHIKFIISIKYYISKYLNIIFSKFIEFLVNLIFCKSNYFMYKFYNKYINIFNTNKIISSYIKLNNSFEISYYTLNNTFNYYKLKFTLFYILNIEFLSINPLLNKFLYTSLNNNAYMDLKKILKLVYDKWIMYTLHNKYLFIIWFFQKIWFKFFNVYYMNYIYNFKNFSKCTLLTNLNTFLELSKKYVIYFNININKHNSLVLAKNFNLFIKLKKFISNLKVSDIKIKEFYKFLYITSYFTSLIYTIEKTLLFYNSKNIIYLVIPNIFLFIKPFMTSAKMVCDYLYFKLKKRLTINVAYNKIRKWQLAERSLVAVSFKIKYTNFMSKASIDPFKNQLFNNTFFRETIEFRTPLKGIRCVCSGPPYKAKRKLRNFYHIWVANFNLTGWMPLQQLRYKIDYHQTFIVLKRATIGLKVWILLESYIVLK